MSDPKLPLDPRLISLIRDKFGQALAEAESKFPQDLDDSERMLHMIAAMSDLLGAKWAILIKTDGNMTEAMKLAQESLRDCIIENYREMLN